MLLDAVTLVFCVAVVLFADECNSITTAVICVRCFTRASVVRQREHGVPRVRPDCGFHAPRTIRHRFFCGDRFDQLSSSSSSASASFSRDANSRMPSGRKSGIACRNFGPIERRRRRAADGYRELAPIVAWQVRTCHAMHFFCVALGDCVRRVPPGGGSSSDCSQIAS